MYKILKNDFFTLFWDQHNSKIYKNKKFEYKICKIVKVKWRNS